MTRRGNTNCQHALVMLRWLERPPEDFIARPRPGTAGVPKYATTMRLAMRICQSLQRPAADFVQVAQW